MPKQKKAKTKRGPFLAAALFCERTLQEKEDNAITIVRMFDTVTLQLDPAAPPEVPSKKHRLPAAVSGLVSFKSGDCPGPAHLKLIVESPSGKKQVMFNQTVTLSDEPNGGFNFRISMTFAISSGGLFLMHVYLNNKRYTSVPLSITVVRAALPASPSLPLHSEPGK